MENYFLLGGIEFMSLISAMGVAMLFFAIDTFLKQRKGVVKNRVNYIGLFGALALCFGVLGQAIGLMQAFGCIELMGGMSQGIIAGGLRVSMITSIYGAMWFILSLPLWFVLRQRNTTLE